MEQFYKIFLGFFYSNWSVESISNEAGKVADYYVFTQNLYPGPRLFRHS